MTSVFACGFECGQLGTVGQHWSTIFGSPTIDTTLKRNGARSLNCTSAGARTHVTSVALTSANLWVVRFAVYFTSLPTVDYRLFNLVDASAGVLFKSSDSKIYTVAGLITNIGATGFSVTTGQWYVIDVKVNMSANPWLIDAQVNGTALGQYSHAVAATSATQFSVGSSQNNAPTANVNFDDFVASNTSGDYPIGDGYGNHFIPTSDGTHNIAGANDFERSLTGVDITNATTDSYLLVDEVPLDTGTPTDFINMVAPPNATDYTENIFGPAPGISTPTTGPQAVEILCPIAQAGTGLGNMVLRLNDNSTIDDIYSATGVAGVTTCTYKRKHYATAPSTGTAWSSSLFNALRIRFGSPAAVDANPDQFFVGAMIEADFKIVTTSPRSFAFMHG